MRLLFSVLAFPIALALWALGQIVNRWPERWL